MDQSRPGEPKLPFFGRPAKTNTSLAGVWPANPVPIVPAFITRQSPTVHTLRFFPPVTMTRSSDEKADVLANTETFNRVIEQMIRACPEQYFWMHNRWKD